MITIMIKEWDDIRNINRTRENCKYIDVDRGKYPSINKGKRSPNEKLL